MRLFSGKLTLAFLGLLALASHCWAAEQAETKSSAKQQIQKRQPAVKAAATRPSSPKSESSNIVARIGDYVITKKQLEQRLMSELRPYGYEPESEKTEPVDAAEVLMKMIAEKAMVMEARKQGYLQDEEIQTSLKRFKERKLASLAWARYMQGKQNELVVTKAEIDKQIKANPQMSRKQAIAMLQRTKAGKVLNQYYNQLCKKFHLQKESRNFPRAAQIHRRLLRRPKEPRKQWWITNKQIRNELTPEEKNIVLATYDNGKVTLKDWFYALSDITPPYRPRDLNTAKGVERLLDRALRLPVLVAEAESLGLDKDKDYLKQVREWEDRNLLGKATTEKVKDVNEPTEEQIIAYFEKNKQAFAVPRTLKIDQIWCKDRSTAHKVKAELESGRDFETVKQQYSLRKQSKPFNTNAGSEGMFFEDLWKGDPNEIVGPVKGFYGDEIKWRIVKILDKKPTQLKEYSDDLKGRIRLRMMDEQRNAILTKYKNELLQKYPYEIYAERIKDIDPLDIP